MQKEADQEKAGVLAVVGDIAWQFRGSVERASARGNLTEEARERGEGGTVKCEGAD